MGLIEGALSDPGDPGSGAEGRHGDLVSGIQAVAAQMRTRRLDVQVEITGDRAPVVPAPAAAAISAAVREVLCNVAAHAGTGQAWVQGQPRRSARSAAWPGPSAGDRPRQGRRVRARADADVILLDLDLRDESTVERNVAAILAAGPAVLVLSASEKPVAVRTAMRAGALGYAFKSEQTGQIQEAIREVAAGRAWISPRLATIFATDDAADRPALSQQEARALQLYATGMPLKSVARKMTISDETVKQYLGRVREKYALAGRAAPTKLELYHRAVGDGYLPPTP